jgi:hypothetical protein
MQVWWVLCTATLCALPLTIWEFRNHGWSPHYQGTDACTSSSAWRMFVGWLRSLTPVVCVWHRNRSHPKQCLFCPARRTAWFIGGLFVILTVPVSVYEVRRQRAGRVRPLVLGCLSCTCSGRAPAPATPTPTTHRHTHTHAHMHTCAHAHARARAGGHAHRVLHAPAPAAPRDPHPVDGAHLLARRVVCAALQGRARVPRPRARNLRGVRHLQLLRVPDKLPGGRAGRARRVPREKGAHRPHLAVLALPRAVAHGPGVHLGDQEGALVRGVVCVGQGGEFVVCVWRGGGCSGPDAAQRCVR